MIFFHTSENHYIFNAITNKETNKKFHRTNGLDNADRYLLKQETNWMSNNIAQSDKSYIKCQGINIPAICRLMSSNNSIFGSWFEQALLNTFTNITRESSQFLFHTKFCNRYTNNKSQDKAKNSKCDTNLLCTRH